MAFRRTRILLLLIFLGLALEFCPRFLRSADVNRADSLAARRNQLLDQIVRSFPKGAYSGLRAAEELRLLGNIDRVARRTLLKVIKQAWTNRWMLPLDRLEDALASAGPEAASDVLAILKASDPAKAEFSWWVESLGRIGPAAKVAIPCLREKLADPNISLYNFAFTRVALANIGDDSKEAVASIIRLLRRDYTTWGYVVHAMKAVRPGKWVDDEVLSGLVWPFQQNAKKYEYADLYEAGIVLGGLGTKAASAIEHLEKARKSTLKDGNASAIIYSLAVARVAPERQKAVLRQLSKDLQGLLRLPDRVTQWMLLECYELVDARIAKQLARMLDDADSEIAFGAAILLWWAGLSAQEVFPEVLQFVQRVTLAKDKRVPAAIALGRLGTLHQLPGLEKAVKTEKTEEVRMRLRTAIRDIKNCHWDVTVEDYPGSLRLTK